MWLLNVLETISLLEQNVTFQSNLLKCNKSALKILPTPFGLIRIALVVVPFLYVGTRISKNFAALLEEHDIFVPEDDDDDD
uniref:Essential MCU regulator, mitochondrial n=1 Tax=Neogobius melanostomus TaxID=47308 RepID=A0A8C6WG13_9GOBI